MKIVFKLALVLFFHPLILISQIPTLLPEPEGLTELLPPDLGLAKEEFYFDQSCIKLPELKNEGSIINRNYYLYCYPRGDYNNPRSTYFANLVVDDIEFYINKNYDIEKIVIEGNADGLFNHEDKKWEDVQTECRLHDSGRIDDLALAFLRACTMEYYLKEFKFKL
ncbi:MAG: hypothetical protein AAGI07_17225, partial [Bacteroidota bacterium]